MVAIDGLGFDWSFMDDEEKGSSQMALMAFTATEIQDHKACSNTCTALKELKLLIKQYDGQKIQLAKTDQDLFNYKCGLESTERQILYYKKNELTFTDAKTLLENDILFKDEIIMALKEALDRVKAEKGNIQLTVEKLEYAPKNVNNIIDSQVNNKVKSGLGYNTASPPYRGIPKPQG
jgi:hypothetical protein